MRTVRWLLILILALASPGAAAAQPERFEPAECPFESSGYQVQLDTDCAATRPLEFSLPW